MEQLLNTPNLSNRPVRMLAGQLAVRPTNLPQNLKGYTRTPPTGELEWGDYIP